MRRLVKKLARSVQLLLAMAAVTVSQIIFTSESRGQTPEPHSFINQQRAVQENLRKEFDAQLGASSRAAFDWGGWYGFNVFVFDDGVESSRSLRRHDLRLWGRLTLDGGAHEFYARGRVSLIDFNHGDSYDGNHDDIDGINLERGIYRLDVSKAMGRTRRSPDEFDFLFTAGRDLVYFGTGLALAAPLDHVSFRGVSDDFEFNLLAGKSVGSTQDFDLTRAITRERRNFLGAQLTYRRPERHEPFVYALWQRDQNDDVWWPPFQDYDYDSAYFGMGSTGELVTRLRYEVEGVYESGRSANPNSMRRNDVSAWAGRAQLEYLFLGPKKARASIEYLFGSGDADRLGSPTNTLGGNANDLNDSGFIGFGYQDTGLVFAPRYSNLHMWRAGASFYPLPEHEHFSKLEVGTDWYLFHKQHHSAAVSDPTADVTSGFLGWEIDCFANWRMTHDFAWTARGGVFFPGRAFDDQTTRTFLLIGMVWSF